MNCGFKYAVMLLVMKLLPQPIFWRKFLWSIFSLSFPLFVWISIKQKTYIIEWTLLEINSTHLSLPLIIDPIGLIFSSVVLFISSNVIHFANTYIQGEIHIKRFSVLVILFVLSINLLIFIPHIIALLIGWDGLGLVSFLLVIYYQNPKSLAAGIITALTNRIGDVLLLLAIRWSLIQGHWIITNMWACRNSLCITLLIIFAAITKRAQIPFSRWLPAAIAAPTPVSALVHSSTLVTAGVFILIRFYPSLSLFQYFNKILLILATLTIFMAGINAIAECDLKKIIALSTLRQLGVIIRSIGLNMPLLAFFHLATHALFKALLFVCAGTLIHIHHHSQDLRIVGNLSSQIPLTMACLLRANIALCGLPFIAGFYSKDLIIEFTLFNQTNIVIIIIFILATILTAAYSVRLTLTALLSLNSSLPIQITRDSDTNTTTPIIFLTRGAVMGGGTINWLISPLNEPVLEPLLKLLPFVVTLIGAIIAVYITLSNLAFAPQIPITHNINALMWFLAPLSSQNIIKPRSYLSHFLLKHVDQGWTEIFRAQAINKSLTISTSQLQTSQKLSITSHLTLISIALILSFYIYLDSLIESMTLKMLIW